MCGARTPVGRPAVRRETSRDIALVATIAADNRRDGSEVGREAKWEMPSQGGGGTKAPLTFGDGIFHAWSGTNARKSLTAVSGTHFDSSCGRCPARQTHALNVQIGQRLTTSFDLGLRRYGGARLSATTLSDSFSANVLAGTNIT